MMDILERRIYIQEMFELKVLTRNHEIAYGFGGPSEKNVSPH
jgi:hypothetical protein